MLAERNSYDHRIRAEVVQTGSLALIRGLKIPESTKRSWIRRGLPRNFVALQRDDDSRQSMHRRIRQLEQQVRVLATVIRLLRTVLAVVRPHVDLTRIPDAASKRAILHAVKRARCVLAPASVYKVLGLPPARLREWQRRKFICALDDRPSCPVSRPTRVTPVEQMAIKHLATSVDHRHFSVRALALHAQRIGAVFASPGTWGRLIRERGWRRPKQRVHPEKPTVGIRAKQPNEIWHVDTSVLRLLDGTHVYIRGVIDNYSRKILAFSISTTFDAGGTAKLLVEAARFLPDVTANAVALIADAGVENLNAEVDRVLDWLPIRRVIAQLDIRQSNSMIEAFWCRLKNGWLFLHTLDTASKVKELATFFVEQHNTVMPHSAFNGHTPDEMYLGTAPDLGEQLEQRRRVARERRLEANRRSRCGACRTADTGAPGGAH